MSLKLFITGTDTGVGKTYLSTGILRLFNQHGYSTLGIKPIATGMTDVNSDVAALYENASIKLDYRFINAFTFQLPIAPHIAAHQAGIQLTAESIISRIDYALNYPAQVQIIEGIGGWHVPLNSKETMENIVRTLQLNVILVVGIRLGCLNHALLSVRAIKAAGVNFVGWVANCIDIAMHYPIENIDYLKSQIDVPYLGTILPHQQPEESIDIKSMSGFNMSDINKN